MDFTQFPGFPGFGQSLPPQLQRKDMQDMTLERVIYAVRREDLADRYEEYLRRDDVREQQRSNARDLLGIAREMHGEEREPWSADAFEEGRETDRAVDEVLDLIYTEENLHTLAYQMAARACSPLEKVLPQIDAPMAMLGVMGVPQERVDSFRAYLIDLRGRFNKEVILTGMLVEAAEERGMAYATSEEAMIEMTRKVYPTRAEFLEADAQRRGIAKEMFGRMQELVSGIEPFGAQLQPLFDAMSKTLDDDVGSALREIEAEHVYGKR